MSLRPSVNVRRPVSRPEKPITLNRSCSATAAADATAAAAAADNEGDDVECRWLPWPGLAAERCDLTVQSDALKLLLTDDQRRRFNGD